MMYIYIIGLFVFQQACCAGDIENLVQLRKAQETADYAEYNAYEDEIHKKQECLTQKAVSGGKWWQGVVAAMHAFPWIVWQVLCLVFLYIGMLLVLYRMHMKYILFVLLCVIITGCIVGYGYYERHKRVGFISEEHVPLYIYPGGKAIRSYISYGDEVAVHSASNDYVLVSSDDKRGWVAWHMVQEI